MSVAETTFGYPDPAITPFDCAPEKISYDFDLRILRPLGDLSCTSAARLDDFMGVRYDYVQAMNWLPDAEDDIDRYDNDVRTQHILRADDESGSVLGGMRLTQASSVEETLTWEMMQANPEMREAARNSEAMTRVARAAGRGALHDLTRLVIANDRITDLRVHKDTILDVFGAGYEATRDDGEDVAWFFLTTSKVRTYLGRIGLASDTLVSDKVTPGDKEDSHLCVVYPQPALEKARRSNKLHVRYTYKRVVAAANSFLA